MDDRLKNLADAKKILDDAKKQYAAAEAEATAYFQDKIKAAYLDKGDQFGTAYFFDGEQKVKVSTTKTVSWDQEKLASLYADIKRGNENPDDYIKVEFSISEEKFNAWPEAIKDAFIPARTVKPGKAKIEIAGDKDA